MQPIQTVNDGVILAGDVDDLKELLIANCGHDIWSFIKYDDETGMNSLRSQIEELEEDNKDLESENENQSNEIIALQDELFNSDRRIEALEKELEDLKSPPAQTIIDDDEDYITF